MSGSQKALKVISILLVVMGALSVVLGVLLLAGGVAADMGSEVIADGGVSVNGMAVVGLVAVSGIVSGLVDLVIGILGLKGANRPEKVGAFWAIALIGVVLNAVDCGLMLFGGTFDVSSIVNLVLVLICFVLANNIKKSAR